MVRPRTLRWTVNAFLQHNGDGLAEKLRRDAQAGAGGVRKLFHEYSRENLFLRRESVLLLPENLTHPVHIGKLID